MDAIVRGVLAECDDGGRIAIRDDIRKPSARFARPYVYTSTQKTYVNKS